MNNDIIYRYAERKANIFNLSILGLMTLLGGFTLILNALGFFSPNKSVVSSSMIAMMAISLIPCIVALIHDYILRKKPTIIIHKNFKSFVIIISFIDVLILGIALSFHATLILAVPSLMASQYKRTKKILFVTFITSILLVIIVVYGSFLFGIYDANMLKPITLDESKVFENRLNLLTQKRIFEVFLHYAVPKIICVVTIDFIGFQMSRRTSEMVNMQISLSSKIQEEIISKTNMQNGVIEHLADVIESRDLETGEHIKRTKKYVSILVNKMRHMDKYREYLTEKTCENIINAAPLHDIGKIAVSDVILRKPGKLTKTEFDAMKVHTTKGGEIINNILNDLGDKEFLNIAYEVATAHHEKWNGLGYPNGLKGEDIPLPGRIMAIADVFDALIAERVYKKPMPIDKAIKVIIDESGTHFDPDLVLVFKESINDFKEASTTTL